MQPVPENLRHTRITEKEWNDFLALTSAAYLLASIENAYTENANEILDHYGLSSHRVKHTFNNYRRAFSQYNSELHHHVIPEHQKDLVDDYELLSQLIQQYIMEEDQTKWNYQLRYNYEVVKHKALESEARTLRAELAHLRSLLPKENLVDLTQPSN